MGNLKIGVKIGGGYVVLLAVTGVIIMSMISTQGSIEEMNHGIANERIPNLLASQELLTAVAHQSAGIRGYLLTQDEGFLNEYREGAKEGDEAYAKLVELSRGEEKEHVENVMAIGRDLEELKGHQDMVLSLFREGKTGEAIGLQGEVEPLMMGLHGKLDKLAGMEKEELFMHQGMMEKSMDDAKRNSVLLLVFGILTVGALGFLVTRNIVKPLNMLIDASQAVSRGDLTRDVAIKTKDEIGDLADSFREMTKSLRDLVSQVQGSSQRVAATSQELAASSEEMTATTTQVSTTVQQIATGAQGQSRQVGKASEEVKRISEKAQKIADTAESIELITDNTNRVSKEAGDAARNAAARMEKIQTSVDQSAAVVKELGERSKRIGEIVDVITSIAEQTNLLALNAAIEAARAGEHGRGFAVVAEEVRKLAEGSAKAADEISGLIQSIQAETGKAVESMESGSKEVSEGVEVVDKALSALNNISSGVEEIAKWFQEISGATKEQTALTESVVKAMDEVAMKAEEAGAGTEEASAAAEEQTASMEEISSSAQELSALALQLQEAASRFKLNGASESVAEEVTKINEFPLNDAVNKVPEVVAANGGEKEP